jgi:hypothetical protein
MSQAEVDSQRPPIGFEPGGARVGARIVRDPPASLPSGNHWAMFRSDVFISSKEAQQR